jgi:hypothetical protein
MSLPLQAKGLLLLQHEAALTPGTLLCSVTAHGTLL